MALINRTVSSSMLELDSGESGKLLKMKSTHSAECVTSAPFAKEENLVEELKGRVVERETWKLERKVEDWDNNSDPELKSEGSEGNITGLWDRGTKSESGLKVKGDKLERELETSCNSKTWIKEFVKGGGRLTTASEVFSTFWGSSIVAVRGWTLEIEMTETETTEAVTEGWTAETKETGTTDFSTTTLGWSFLVGWTSAASTVSKVSPRIWSGYWKLESFPDSDPP